MENYRNVAVIDYGMGNLRSVLKAWQVAGANSRLISSPNEISADDILVFPGQGCIVDAMKLLKTTNFDSAIKDWISANKPFFGICLGLQALFEFSEEGGGVECLGVLKGTVNRLKIPRQYKVPHMGWNNVDFKEKNNALLKDIDATDQFYFVHSYCVDCLDTDAIFGTTEYGGKTFTTAIARGNLVATQFHPEKSQIKGLTLYRNFLEITK
ncbi:MAG: imidazole glycerol phosphate synthase subunit HisH [Verrucomicrobiaceae bacterium]|nr:imidazole glycerol phosphate synthase subunit HisH [Verrucomicrobiaceae bacterium]